MLSPADAIIIIAVLGLPLLVVMLLARVSGWTKLHAAYPARNVTMRGGKWVRFRSAQVGGHMLGGINNGLNIYVSEAGLRFSVFMVGFAYRAFFVPWNEIEIADQGKREVTLRFTRVPDVPLKFSARTFDRVMALAAAHAQHRSL